jgi:hypothetical protein
MHPLAFALFQRYSDAKPRQGRWKMMNQLRGFIDVLDVDGRILQSVNRMAITHLRFGTRAYTEDSVEHDGISN